MRMAHPSLLSWSLLAGSLAAQASYVVDRLGRPGSHFTDLPAAAAAAADGDTLILRSDSGAFTAITTSKALTIVGDAAGVAVIATASAGFRVQSVRAGRDFTLRNCDFYSPSTNIGVPLSITGSLGRVHLQGISVYNYNGSPGVEVVACVGVTIRECQFLGAPGLLVRNATVALGDSRCLGNGASSGTLMRPAYPGARCFDSHVTASCVEFRGGLAAGTFPPGEGLHLFGSTVTATGVFTLARISAGFYGSGGGSMPVPAVLGSTSLLRLDPAVVVEARGGAQPIIGVTAVPAALAALSVTGRNIFTVSYQGAAGSAAATLVGLPADPYAIYGVDGRLWIDPSVLIAVPGVPALLAEGALPRGLTLVLQVASVRSGNLEITGPAALTSRF